MKKLLLQTLAILLVIGLLTGCAGTTVVIYQPAATTGNNAPAAEGALKLGLAVAPSISGSKAAAAEENGKADFDVTLVAVLVDDEGIIRDCIIDSVGASANFDTAGQPVNFDAEKKIQTKNELGDNYGMKAYGGAKHEWYEQAAAVAAFAVNKTAAQLREGAVNEAGKAKNADLASVATIYIGSYVSAIEKAVQNARHLGSAAGDTLRLSVINGMTATAAGEKDGALELTVDVAAVTTKDQVISGCYIDALQAKVTFNAQGELTTDVTAAPQTKNELGEKYGMKAYAGAKFEWNEQAANFAAYVTNKTLAEVAGIAITEAAKPADGTDLAATVTIAIGGFQALFAKLS